MLTVEGNSLNNKYVCPVDLDNTEYNSLPIVIISVRSTELVIGFEVLYIKAHKLIATHCLPALSPKTLTLPWLYGAQIVLLPSIGPGFFSISLLSLNIQ